MGANREQRIEVDAAKGLDAVRSCSSPLSYSRPPHIYCGHLSWQCQTFRPSKPCTRSFCDAPVACMLGLWPREQNVVCSVTEPAYRLTIAQRPGQHLIAALSFGWRSLQLRHAFLSSSWSHGFS